MGGGRLARRGGGVVFAASTAALLVVALVVAASSDRLASASTFLVASNFTPPAEYGMGEHTSLVYSNFTPSSNLSVNAIPLYDDEAPLGAYRPNLYKKTHSSVDPINERIWLVTNLGFPWDGEDEYWYDGTMAGSTRTDHMAELSDQVDLCAYRSTFSFLGDFLWHEVGSTVTPEGAVGVGAFYDYVTKLHTTGADQGEWEAKYEWDAYVYLASAFYVPSGAARGCFNFTSTLVN